MSASHPLLPLAECLLSTHSCHKGSGRFRPISEISRLGWFSRYRRPYDNGKLDLLPSQANRGEQWRMSLFLIRAATGAESSLWSAPLKQKGIAFGGTHTTPLARTLTS